ncbi:MAG TPA: succinylglutamate desuccinylase/aspartoacylase family protein [Methylococcaceae bacterium]|jgi:predicted deacylase|nr:succinylglutamate desuccinylase/aspartoacylase family protein [Methylococcaceae bacterium]
MVEPFIIGGIEIAPGERATLELPIASLSNHTPMTMPVHVVRGRYPGACLLISAALHGDEINGVEIIRRLVRHSGLERLRGTLLCVPVVNVFGFVSRSRYLPDGRDLNRSFPGSPRGSLAARLADAFMKEIVAKCTHVIDLHTAAIHRVNLPQIRAKLDDPATLELARAFGVPVLVPSQLRDGSLRQAVVERGIPVLLYEAGEALRFEEVAIRAGVRGILNVMRHLRMLRGAGARVRHLEPLIVQSSSWLRAPQSGVLRMYKGVGAQVQPGDILGTIADPFGERETPVETPFAGIAIGRNNLPIVNEGDALFHLARVVKPEDAEIHIESFYNMHADSADSGPEEDSAII